MNLREQLKAEALASAESDLEIVAEWFPLEEEAWCSSHRRAQPVRLSVCVEANKVSPHRIES